MNQNHQNWATEFVSHFYDYAKLQKSLKRVHEKEAILRALMKEFHPQDALLREKEYWSMLRKVEKFYGVLVTMHIKAFCLSQRHQKYSDFADFGLEVSVYKTMREHYQLILRTMYDNWNLCYPKEMIDYYFWYFFFFYPFSPNKKPLIRAVFSWDNLVE